MAKELRPGERLDDLQLKGYEIIQHPGRFCFGMDAVLLSAFIRVKVGECVLDMGTGTGILPLLLAAKTKGRQFTGLEIQQESADMARRSVQHNHEEERIRIVEGDICKASEIFGKAAFDVVCTNPPYMISGHGLANEKDAMTIARHEVLCTLDDILREAKLTLKSGGRFYMVHRPFRLTEILTKMSSLDLEPKRIRLVYPTVEKTPTMVLIEGIQGAKSRITVEPPLIIYGPDGKYSQEIRDFYDETKNGQD